MGALAYGTGAFYHNQNNLDEGLRLKFLTLGLLDMRPPLRLKTKM
jgi:hypothetical protein